MPVNSQQAPQENKPSASSMACAVFTGCALLSTALAALFVVPIAGYIYYQGKADKRRAVRKRRAEEERLRYLKKRQQLDAEKRLKARKLQKEKEERDRARARLNALQRVNKPTQRVKKPTHRTHASTKVPKAPTRRSRNTSSFLTKLRERKAEEKKNRARLYQHLCLINQKRIIKGLKGLGELPLGHLEPATLDKLQKAKALGKPFVDPGQHSDTFDHYYIIKAANGDPDVICTRHGSSSLPHSASSPQEQAKSMGIEKAALTPFSTISPLETGSFSTPKIVQFWAMKITPQGEQTWRKIISEDRQLRAIGLLKSPTGLLALSTDGRLGSDGASVFLHHLSKEGQAQWKKTVEKRKYKRIFSLSKAKDGAFLCGAISKTTRGLQEAALTHFSWEGELKWETKIGSGRKAITKSACNLQDGSILAVGYFDNEAFLAKVKNDTGEVVERRVIEGVRHGKLYSLTQNSDGLICLLGTVYTKGKAGSEFLLAGMKSTDQLLWQWRLGAKRINEPATIITLSNNEFLMGGTVAESFGKAKQMWLHGRTPQGKTTFQAGFQGENVSAIVATKDGGFILAGTTREYAMGRRDIWIIRFSNDKTIMWQRTLGGENDEVPLTIEPTDDGSFIIGGESYYYGLSEREVEQAQHEDFLYVPFVPTDTIMELKNTNFAEVETTAKLSNSQ